MHGVLPLRMGKHVIAKALNAENAKAGTLYTPGRLNDISIMAGYPLSGIV